MEVTGIKGNKYILEDKPFAGGANGSIYSLIGDQSKVVKIYNKKPNTDFNELEEKLGLMTKNPPNASVLNQIAWPLDLVYDASGQFLGFIMPRLTIDKILKEVYVYNPNSSITIKQRLWIARNLCVVTNAIHEAGYAFGDFNPRNIGVNVSTGEVSFMDTDTFHIVTKDKVYRCNDCEPGYVAPEIIIKSEKLKKASPNAQPSFANLPLPTFTRETDLFALAVHIFALLMNGFSPFCGIGESEDISDGDPGTGNEAVLNDSYCFKPGNKPQSAAIISPDEHPQEIMDLFNRAFIDGRMNPGRRPDAVEWYHALDNYLNELKECKKNSKHYFLNSLEKCPWCEADERYAARLNAAINSGKFGKQGTVNPAAVTPKPAAGAGSHTNYPGAQAVTGGVGNPGGQTTAGSSGSAGGQSTTGSQSGKSNPKNKSKVLYGIALAAVIIAAVIFIPAGIKHWYDNRYARQSVEDLTEGMDIYYADFILDSMEEKTIKPAEIAEISGDGSNGGETYTLKLKHGGTIRIESGSSNSGPYEPYVTLLNEKGKEIGTKSFGWMDTEGGWQINGLKAKKKYKIKVKSYSPYKILVYKPKPKVSINGSTIINDSVDYYMQKNTYYFTAPYSGIYRFELNNMDYRVTLVLSDSDGNVIDYKECNNGSGITTDKIKKGEKYYLYNKDSVLTTPYTLEVYMPKKKVNISGYDAVCDAVEYKGAENKYIYRAENSGELMMLFMDLYEDGDEETVVDVKVTDSSGHEIANGSCKNGRYIKVPGMQEGEEYTITVSENNGISLYYMIFDPDRKRN